MIRNASGLALPAICENRLLGFRVLKVRAVRTLPPHIKRNANCQKHERNDKRHLIRSPITALDAIPCALFLEKTRDYTESTTNHGTTVHSIISFSRLTLQHEFL